MPEAPNEPQANAIYQAILAEMVKKRDIMQRKDLDNVSFSVNFTRERGVNVVTRFEFRG